MSTFSPIDGLSVNEIHDPRSDVGRNDSDQSDDGINVWDWFAANIDEFPVAKCIADHFDKHPSQLNCNEVDTLGLYLRAQVTIKRRQVAYAEAQSAILRAREQSRSVSHRLKAAGAFLDDLRRATMGNPAPISMFLLGVAMFLTR